MNIILPTIGTRGDVRPYLPGENYKSIQQSYAYFAMGLAFDPSPLMAVSMPLLLQLSVKKDRGKDVCYHEHHPTNLSHHRIHRSLFAAETFPCCVGRVNRVHGSLWTAHRANSGESVRV
jgi:hypothetical protein